MSRKMTKYCIVPMCKTTNYNKPEKIFVNLPNNQIKRDLWLDALEIERTAYSLRSHLYVCEDHFDLEHDMENFVQFQMMGTRKRMKPDAVPHLAASTKKLNIPSQNEINENIIYCKEFIIKEEINKKLVSNDGLDPLLPDIKEEISESNDTFNKNEYLRNMTTFEKYAQQITTNDNSVVIRPDFVDKTNILGEHNYSTNISQMKTEINKDIDNREEYFIKEEKDEELVLNDELQSLLCEVKKEHSESEETCSKNENFLGENISTEKKNMSDQDKKEHYECYVCYKMYATKRKFMNHIRNHGKMGENLRQEMNKCEICSKSFKFPYILQRHQSSHTKRKQNTCKICHKSFRLLRQLKRHHSVHTGEKQHTCDVCNKSFRLLANLKKHKLIHTGEKPFTCEICNKSFRQTQNLKTHKLIHTGGKPFTCKICKKSFRALPYLKKHYFTHTDERSFSCEICEKTFRHQSSLKQHKFVHTREKPLTCKICSKSFRYHKTLKSHKRLHTRKN